jgi:uncharacterized damage-inducible protein DinB
MRNQNEIREHVFELLRGKSAHISVEDAVRDFPLDRINDRPGGSPHTAWELLEHIRIAQWDILEFSRNAAHISPDFPEGYWNKTTATAADWKKSVDQVLIDLRQMRELVADENTDLLAKIPHGDGQTALREALLVSDHNAYHLGQLMLLKKMFESEPPA